VEVWDVVDRAKNAVASPSTEAGIKLEHSSPQKQQPKRGTPPASTAELGELGLDASTVNVYRNCHAVIFMFDMTKPWTFEYVIKELPSVPGNVSILVLVSLTSKYACETPGGVAIGEIQI
jgi:hypothetical protein